MKSNILVYLTILMFFGSLTQGFSQKKNELKFMNQLDSVSYIIGNNIGANFKQNSIQINKDILIKGIDDGIMGAAPIFPDSVVKKVMTAFQKNMYAKQDEKRKTEADLNKKDGEKFLAENKKKEGVTTLADGLQYKVIKMGTGPKPIETDKVKVNYEGTLTNGTIFDSSYERKEPVEFPVNQVIKGWTEALQLMPVGSTWMLYIPSELGYGEREAGKIPPGSTLIFKVELLSIEKNDEPKEEKNMVPEKEIKK